MKFFSNLMKPIKASFSRFAAMYIFCIIAAVMLSIEIVNGNNNTDFSYYCFLDSAWMSVFSVLVKIAFESFFPIENAHSKKARTFVNVIPFVLSIPFFFFCLRFSESEYVTLIYFTTLGAMVFALFYFFSKIAKEKNASNLVIAFFISSILSACVGGSLNLILVAIDNLICTVPLFERTIGIIWSFSSLVIWIGSFISYATKKYEDINIPKAIKVIFNYTLLPLFAMYILVLYIYFVKCIFIRTMPSGTINPFVSIATCFFMVLYLVLENYENPVLRFFRKMGALFLVPLVVLQIIGYSIRVSSYGYTPARYFSLLYIIVSSLFLLMAILNGIFKFKFALGKNIFLIFSGAFIFCCLPLVNVIDFTQRSIVKRIEKIYHSNEMFVDGEFVNIENADKVLSPEEKEEIKSLDESLMGKKGILWHKEDFEKTYGFKRYEVFDSSKSGFIVISNSSALNIDGYKSLRIIDSVQYKKDSEESIIIITTDKSSFDVTEEILPLMSTTNGRLNSLDGPLEFESKDGSYKIVFTNGYIEKTGKSKYASFDGFVLGKNKIQLIDED